ncbi:hypothetical protein BBJ28_00002588 [Nothophytophthora sp. Chile5]|nr:hypothetical protein BBJ28_00002588 [Nothophytophthora sp. Chile5]
MESSGTYHSSELAGGKPGGRASNGSSHAYNSSKDRSSAYSGGRSGSGNYPSSSSGRGALPRRGSSNSVGGGGSTSSRDRDRGDRDRDRDRDGRARPRSRSRDGGSGSSREKSSRSSSRNPFGGNGGPAVRLRERKNLLLMHRTGARRADLSPGEAAVRVIGVDTSYMKVRLAAQRLSNQIELN